MGEEYAISCFEYKYLHLTSGEASFFPSYYSDLHCKTWSYINILYYDSVLYFPR